MSQPRVFRLGLAGDTMLGRCVADHLLSGGRESNSRVRVDRDPTIRHHSLLFSDDVVDLAREADVMFLNLECCISEHDERWQNPYKPFFFRAPPTAVRELKLLKVQGVTLGNNHALDYGVKGLLDTLAHLDQANIQVVGAGRSRDEARRPLVLRHEDFTLGIIGLSDHPEEFSATPDSPGIAYADLRHGVPEWVEATARRLHDHQACSAVMVTPHWGPNMCPSPLPYVRQAAGVLHKCPQVQLIAGHSAHNIQGVWGEGRCVFDMGDLMDDYAVDHDVRNDLGLFFYVLFDRDTKRPLRVEAVPLKLEFCHTRLARGDEQAWVKDRFTRMCAELGTTVRDEKGRLVIDLP